MAPKGKKQSKSNDRDDKRNGENEGWETVTADRAPWLVKSPGLVVTGYLLGRFSFGQGRDKRWYYQIKLTRGDIEGITGSGDDQETTTLDKGDVISVGESFSLQRDLAPLTDDGGKYEVKLVYGEPTRDKQGKVTFWPIITSKKTLSPPKRKPRIEESENLHREPSDPTEPDDSDIPF